MPDLVCEKVMLSSDFDGWNQNKQVTNLKNLYTIPHPVSTGTYKFYFQQFRLKNFFKIEKEKCVYWVTSGSLGNDFTKNRYSSLV